MTDRLEAPDGLIELTVPLEAKMNLAIMTDFDADKLDRTKWMKKYGDTPYRPVMSDEEFFDALNLDAPGLDKVAIAVTDGDLAGAKTALIQTASGELRPPGWADRIPFPLAARRGFRQARGGSRRAHQDC
ncbi:MAG: hypothetical protein V1800_01990 [Candidatus Latescibacterota bacterium]